MNNKRINKKRVFVLIFVIIVCCLTVIKFIGYDNGLYISSLNNQVAQNATKGNDITNSTKEMVNCLNTGNKKQVVDGTKNEGSNEPSSKSNQQTSNTKQTKSESCNMTELKKQLDKTPIIYSEEYQVYMPIYTASPKDSLEQHTDLDKGAITYNSYGTPGKGNYDVFGHNAFEEGQYFTSFAKHLKKGDKVYLLAKDGKDYKKFEYTIKYKYEVDKDDVSSVYYESDKPIITIGTCKVPYKTENRVIWQGDLTNTTNI